MMKFAPSSLMSLWASLLIVSISGGKLSVLSGFEMYFVAGVT